MSRNLHTNECPVCRLRIDSALAQQYGIHTTRSRKRYRTGAMPGEEGRVEYVRGYEVTCPGPESRWLNGDRKVETTLLRQCNTPLWFWRWEPDDQYSSLAEPRWMLSWSRSWNDEPKCYACMDAPDHCEECR